MSRITKLIEELCPNGVEYKPLSEIADIIRGKRITKKDLTEEGVYPVMSGGITFMGRYNEFNRQADTITISSYGQAGYIDFIKEKFLANDVCLTVFPKEMIENKFLYYALKNMQNYLYSNTTKAIPDHIPTKFLMELEIPVPPRPIQDEIVRILDNFTELTDRRKQYEYYRDYLLTPKSNIEYKKISDFATITRGGSFQKSDFVDVGRPAIHYGKIYTNYGISTSQTLNYINEEVFNKSRKAQPNDIVMAVTSENVEDVCKCVAWLGNEDVAVSGHTAIIHHNQNPKYLSYYFHTSMFAKQKEKLAHGTKVIEVTPDRLNDIEIPIPPMDVQNRIVEVLDNFDKICNDFEIGLPAEVEMRQKQYEFFRDKLLTFDLNLERILQTDRQTDRQAIIKLIQYVFGYVNVKLKDVALINRGKRVVRNELINDGKYKVYQNALSPLGTYNKFNREENKTFLISAGAAGQIGYSSDKFWAADDCFTFNCFYNLNERFLFHVLKNQQMKIDSLIRKASIPRISKESIESIEFPLYSVGIQGKIVETLDNFEMICNDLITGLPAEIEMRQKQYEYYRNKLLAFKRGIVNES